MAPRQYPLSVPAGWPLLMFGKLTMQTLGGFIPSRNSLLFCREKTNMNGFPVHSDVCTPLLCGLAKSDAFRPRSVRFGDCYVPHILAFGGETKIAPSIVRWIFVNVIYGLLGPRTCHHSPNNSMSLKNSVLNANQNSTGRVFASGRVAGLAASSSMDFPCQNTCFWVIVKKVVESLCGNHASYLPQTAQTARGKY